MTPELMLLNSPGGSTLQWGVGDVCSAWHHFYKHALMLVSTGIKGSATATHFYHTMATELPRY